MPQLPCMGMYQSVVFVIFSLTEARSLAPVVTAFDSPLQHRHHYSLHGIEALIGRGLLSKSKHKNEDREQLNRGRKM